MIFRIMTSYGVLFFHCSENPPLMKERCCFKSVTHIPLYNMVSFYNVFLVSRTHWKNGGWCGSYLALCFCSVPLLFSSWEIQHYSHGLCRQRGLRHKMEETHPTTYHQTMSRHQMKSNTDHQTMSRHQIKSKTGHQII